MVICCTAWMFLQVHVKEGGTAEKETEPCAPCVHIGSLYETTPPQPICSFMGSQKIQKATGCLL